MSPTEPNAVIGAPEAEVLKVVAKIWEDVFNTSPPNDTTLATIANGKDEKGVRQMLLALKAQMDCMSNEDQEVNDADITLHWKGQIELETMEEDHGCVVPSIPIVELSDLDIQKSAAEGVEIEIFRLILSRRFEHPDGTKADALMNFEGRELQKKDRVDFLTNLSHAIVQLHDRIMDGKSVCEFTTVPLSKSNTTRGPIIATDKDGAQMLGLLAIPSFLSLLKERVKKASSEDNDRFELVVLPISKRVIVACNAYDKMACIALSRINQDPGIAGNPRERLKYACPLIVKHNRLQDQEDLEPCDILEILTKNECPIVYEPYPYRSACLLAIPKGELRGIIPPHAPWGGYFTPSPEGKGLTGCCSSCGSNKTDLRLCSACGRAAYCDDECQKKHWVKHKHLCIRERDSQSFWRDLAKDQDEAEKEGVSVMNAPAYESKQGKTQVVVMEDGSDHTESIGEGAECCGGGDCKDKMTDGKVQENTCCGGDTRHNTDALETTIVDDHVEEHSVIPTIKMT